MDNWEQFVDSPVLRMGWGALAGGRTLVSERGIHLLFSSYAKILRASVR